MPTTTARAARSLLRRPPTPATRRAVRAVLREIVERPAPATKRELYDALGGRVSTSTINTVVNVLTELGVLTSTTVTRPHAYKPSWWR